MDTWLGVPLLMVAALLPRETLPRTEAFWSADDEVTVVCRLEFFGDGLPRGRASRRLVRWWVGASERRWNRAPSFEAGKGGARRAIRLRFEFRWRIRGAAELPAPGWHQIEVVDQLRELLTRGRGGRLMEGYRSWMVMGGAVPPGERAGCFGNLNYPTIIAHELGHLLGLEDEYEPDPNRLDQLLRAFTSRRTNLMETSWIPWARIFPRHVEAIYRNATRFGWWVPR